MTLDEILARLDTSNWDEIARRVSNELGCEVSVAEVRNLAHTEITRDYLASSRDAEKTTP